MWRIVLCTLVFACCNHIPVNGGDSQPAMGMFFGEVAFPAYPATDGMIFSFEGERETLLVMATRDGFIAFNRKVEDKWTEFPVRRYIEGKCLYAKSDEIVAIEIKFCQGDPAVWLKASGFRLFIVAHFVKRQEKPNVEKHGI